MATATTPAVRTPEFAEPASQPDPKQGSRELLLSLLLGVFFGVVLTKSEVLSWFRIQEMFRFQAFHMYGIIGLAIGVAALSLRVIRALGLRTLAGEPVQVERRSFNRGYSQALGGLIFGAGWALLGACPGPLFALIGGGVTVMSAALVSAVAGAWAYGALRSKLPH